MGLSQILEFENFQELKHKNLFLLKPIRIYRLKLNYLVVLLTVADNKEQDSPFLLI